MGRPVDGLRLRSAGSMGMAEGSEVVEACWVAEARLRMVVDVGGREQMMRPQRRQWCFRFVREKMDLRASQD